MILIQNTVYELTVTFFKITVILSLMIHLQV